MAEDERDECLAYFNHQTFGISVALSFTVFLEKLVNAQQRWRRLRSAACALQGIIWQAHVTDQCQDTRHSMAMNSRNRGFTRTRGGSCGMTSLFT